MFKADMSNELSKEIDAQSITKEDYEKGVLLGDELKKELTTWIIKRNQLISLLNTIADDLDEVQCKCEAVELVASSISAVDYASILGAVIATLLTEGAASPLLIGAGSFAAEAGSATREIAELVDHVITKHQNSQVDQLLKEDSEAIKRMENKLNNTKTFSNDLKPKVMDAFVATPIFLCYTFKEVFGYSFLKHGVTVLGTNSMGKMLNCFKCLNTSLESLGTKVSPLALQTILGPLAAIGLVVSIKEIIETSISIHHGSKSEAATEIRNIVREFEKQLETTEEFLKAIPKYKEKVEVERMRLLKETLDNLISGKRQASASEEELITLLGGIWMEFYNFPQTELEHTPIIQCLWSLYRSTKTLIDEKKRKKPQQKLHFSFAILAHGAIQKVNNFPSYAYYDTIFSDNITNVKFFVPWGCNLHATAAASILLGLSYDHIAYLKSQGDNLVDAQTYSARQGFWFEPSRVNGFNDIPQYWPTEVPYVMLHAVYRSENAIMTTTEYMKHWARSDSLKIHPKFTLIPYFNQEGSDFVYPDMPLFVVNKLLSLICHMMSKPGELITCDIQCVSCLGAKCNSGYDPDSPVPAYQYYSTIPSEQVEMRGNFSRDDIYFPNMRLMVALRELFNP